MRCINKKIGRRGIAVLISICLYAGCLSGCGKAASFMPYDMDGSNSSFLIGSGNKADKEETFASKLCISNENFNVSAVDMSKAEAAGLFSLSDTEVIYSKNVHEPLYPASITKVMTALVAIKNGRQDDVLTASNNVTDLEAGAQNIGLKPGDSMTLDQALRIMLMYSATDVAIMVAERYGGSVEGFSEMMNAEARRIGATECYFANPNGLNNEEQLVTAYDLYLIMREASKYSLFREIISMNSYQTVYYDKNGKEKTFDKSATNGYINGNRTAPAGVYVIGGKTGTLTSAGHCLILLVSDTGGNEYVSVILKAETGDDLYSQMNDLLSLIVNS
ncbi:MAG: D-alanyl-D-alanine carboxypeptidase [Lachnospiraceae bacterium]|nr:D-alanyl-D-alanine carboxypeptidase [Lachnospiraceae bacterium]